MVSFLVETYIPQGDRDQFAIAVDGLRAALEAMNVLEHKVEHVRSYLVPSDEMGVHVFEANSVEAVRRLAKLAGIEVERIVAAVAVDPGGTMTPAWDGRKMQVERSGTSGPRQGDRRRAQSRHG